MAFAQTLLHDRTANRNYGRCRGDPGSRHQGPANWETSDWEEREDPPWNCHPNTQTTHPFPVAAG